MTMFFCIIVPARKNPQKLNANAANELLLISFLSYRSVSLEYTSEKSFQNGHKRPPHAKRLIRTKYKSSGSPQKLFVWWCVQKIALMIRRVIIEHDEIHM